MDISHSYNKNKNLLYVSKENAAYCIGLFRLKISETGGIYSDIFSQNLYDPQKDWVWNFLSTISQNSGLRDDIVKERISKTYNSRFINRIPCYDHEAIVDLRVALGIYSSRFTEVFKNLKYFKEIGFLESRVDNLIYNYNYILSQKQYYLCDFIKFLECNLCEYSIIKCDTCKKSIITQSRICLNNTERIWNDIYDIVRLNLIVAQDAKIDVMSFFKELEVYKELLFCLKQSLVSENPKNPSQRILYPVNLDKELKEMFSSDSYKHLHTY